MGQRTRTTASGPACHFPAAGDHRHGHVDVIGAFRPLVAVIGHVLCRPGLDAPMLILSGVDGRQGVLEAHAVLVQSRFSAGAGGNGEGGVHVLDAGAVVPDRDIHIIPLLLQHDLHPAADPVGVEIGNRVVDQFARVWPKSLKLPEMPAKNSLPLGALSMFRIMISRIIVPPKNVFLKTKRTVQVVALHRAGGSYNIPLAPPAEKGYTVPIGAGNPVV